MSIAIIGVAGTVIGAGASLYGTYSSNQAAKKAGSASAAGIPVGQKPVAAEYKPVDFTKEQLDTVTGNLANADKIHGLMDQTNFFMDADALHRAKKIIPGYAQNMALEGNNTNDLLNGRLPYDDVMGIVANRSQNTAALGTPGTAGPATMRDLGLSRLDAIKAGSGMMGSMVDMAEKIDPVGRRMTQQSMYLDPATNIRNRMEQNQIIQQSDQNRNNIAAAATPSEALQAQLMLAQRTGALGGGASGSGVGGYASAIQQLLGGLGGLASKGSSTTPTGTFEGSFASNPSPGVQNRIYRPTSIPV